MAVYEEYQVYGPYKRKDGRMHIVLTHHISKGQIDKRKTVSYPKYIVENYLGRYLTEDETVDHIDGNFSNNELSNLRVVPRSIHCKSHTSSRVKTSKVCVICGKEFITDNINRLTCGNKSCNGKCAHINGFDKGHNFNTGKTNKLISNRSLVEEIQSVEGANSGKPLVGNPEQGKQFPCVETLHALPKSI